MPDGTPLPKALGDQVMPMRSEDEWEYFRGYIDKGSATVVAKHLEVNGVPTQFEERSPLTGDVFEIWVVVQSCLAHRARWILAQLPPNDDELLYLATKRLGETDG